MSLPSFGDGPVEQFYNELFGDVFVATAQVKASDTQYNRRSLVRVVMSTLEAVLFAVKDMILAVDGIVDVLTAAELSLLREQAHSIRDNGDVKSQQKFIPIENNVRFVAKCFAKVYAVPFELDVDKQGWPDFLRVVGIRHRITHPKHIQSFAISDEELEVVNRTAAWIATQFGRAVVALIVWRLTEDDSESAVKLFDLLSSNAKYREFFETNLAGVVANPDWKLQVERFIQRLAGESGTLAQ